jgi:hypothetical protein
MMRQTVGIHRRNLLWNLNERVTAQIGRFRDYVEFNDKKGAGSLHIAS